MCVSRRRGLLTPRSAEESVFVRGTTEGINLVANSWGTENTAPGITLVISEMEHHANIVPRQMLCERKGAELRAIPLHPGRYAAVGDLSRWPG